MKNIIKHRHKGFLILSVILINATTVYGQYKKIPFNQNDYWDYREMSFKLEVATCEYRLSTLRDSVINGKTYHLLAAIKSFCDKPGITSYLGYNCLLRQDTLAQKIWIQLNGTDKLIYNFNKSAGDTASLYDGIAGTIKTFTVSKVDSVLLNNGHYHERQTFSNGAVNVEGVGSLFSLVEPFTVDVFEVTSEIICFSTFAPGSNSLFGINCAKDLAVNEVLRKQQQLFVYPNPAGNKLQIKFANEEVITGDRIWRLKILQAGYFYQKSCRPTLPLISASLARVFTFCA